MPHSAIQIGGRIPGQLEMAPGGAEGALRAALGKSEGASANRPGPVPPHLPSWKAGQEPRATQKPFPGLRSRSPTRLGGDGLHKDEHAPACEGREE